MALHIRFEAGLIEGWVPDVPFVVLADPAAVPAILAERCRQRWGAVCRGWVPQVHARSTLPAASALAQTLWPLLGAERACAIWAIGGGTTLDLAKLLRWRMASLEVAEVAWTQNILPADAVRQPLWCSPTTSGTGSEVTPWATVWDFLSHPPRKRSWHPAQGLADRALIDPELTLSCPLSVTRDCALDALAHAIDSLCNRRADHTSRGRARQSARRVMNELPVVLAASDDLGARTRLAHASLLAGLAMAHTQTSLAHALSYGLTIREGLPHGQACAVWLPMVLDLAVQHSPRVRADVQAVFDLPADQAVASLHAWLQDLGIEARDLRTTPGGQDQLMAALASERGANFVMAGT